MPSAGAPPAPPLSGNKGDDGGSGTYLGPYHLGESIGRGAFGCVYRGLNIQTGVTVAIKRVKLDNMPTEELKSIEMEIQLLRKLKHPNIVKYIDTITTGTDLNIVIEYVENGSLASIVKKFGGGFPETLVAIYISQVLKGLEYLHIQGVIHRDIKGANILATKEGLIKLADFGVATKINDSQKSDSVVGTPYWMAPEIIEMSGSQSTSCDIWSVGCVVVELLTGSPPYFDLQPMPALFRIVQDEHPPLPAGLSPALEDFLLLCFQKDPNMRSKAEDLLKHPWLRSPAHSELVANVEASPTNQSISSNTNQFEEPDFDDMVQSTIRMYKGDLQRQMDSKETDTAAQEEKQGSEDEDWDAEIDNEEAAESVKTIRVASGFIPAQMAGKMIAKQAFESVQAETDVVIDDGFSDMSSTGADINIARDGGDVLANWVEKDEDDDENGYIDFDEGDHEDDMLLDIDISVVERQKNRVWDEENDETAEEVAPDPFANAGFDEIDLVGDHDAKLAEEVHNLLQNLISAISSKQSSVSTLITMIETLRQIFQKSPAQIDSLVISQGVIPLLEIIDISEFLSHTGSRVSADRVDFMDHLLMFVQQIMQQSPRVQQSLSLVGLIPLVIQLIDKRVPMALRVRASDYVRLFCTPTNDNGDIPNLTRKIFIACGGLNSLVSLIDSNGETLTIIEGESGQLDLIFTGIDCIQMVFDTPTNPKNDFCRLFCKANLLRPLTTTLFQLSTSDDKNERFELYIQKILRILLVFGERGDGVVKGYLAKRIVLDNILKLLDVLPEPSVTILLKIIRHMTMEVAVRDELEACGAIPRLVSLLHSPYVNYTNQILPAMYYLFRIKVNRQEEMALCGMIPLLQRNILCDSHLKQFALPMICKLAHTSARVRQELKKYNGIQFYLTLLSQPYWKMQAIDSIAVWLADESRRVELVLRQAHNIHLIIQVFTEPDLNYFGSILRSISKIIALSSVVNKALGKNGVFLENVVHRLSSCKAIIQKPLLMMLRLLFEKHSPSTLPGKRQAANDGIPFKLGEKQGLHATLKQLANDQVSVLVQDLAANLIKDFNIN